MAPSQPQLDGAARTLCEALVALSEMRMDRRSHKKRQAPYYRLRQLPNIKVIFIGNYCVCRYVINNKRVDTLDIMIDGGIAPAAFKAALIAYDKKIFREGRDNGLEIHGHDGCITKANFVPRNDAMPTGAPTMPPEAVLVPHLEPHNIPVPSRTGLVAMKLHDATRGGQSSSDLDGDLSCADSLAKLVRWQDEWQPWERSTARDALSHLARSRELSGYPGLRKLNAQLESARIPSTPASASSPSSSSSSPRPACTLPSVQTTILALVILLVILHLYPVVCGWLFPRDRTPFEKLICKFISC